MNKIIQGCTFKNNIYSNITKIVSKIVREKNTKKEVELSKYCVCASQFKFV